MSAKQLITLTDRLAVAFVSGVAAILTLLLFPIVLCIFAGSASAKGVELVFLYYTYVFSKTGLLIISSASIAGFLLGPDRIATLFSFFWFTHPCWSRLSNYLDEKVSDYQEEYSAPRWMQLSLLLILLCILAWVVPGQI